MNLIYFSLVLIFNFHFSVRPVHSAAAPGAREKAKNPDVMVNGECAHFDTVENYCADEARLKYSADANKNLNHHQRCCMLKLEIECLRPYVDKVCAQHRFLDSVIKKNFNERIEHKNSECGMSLECAEDVQNLWFMLITIFAAALSVAAVCIICFIYIQY